MSTLFTVTMQWRKFDEASSKKLNRFQKCSLNETRNLTKKITAAVSFSWRGYFAPGLVGGRNGLRDAHLRLLYGGDDASAPSPLQVSLLHVLLKYLVCFIALQMHCDRLPEFRTEYSNLDALKGNYQLLYTKPTGASSGYRTLTQTKLSTGF